MFPELLFDKNDKKVFIVAFINQSYNCQENIEQKYCSTLLQLTLL